MKKLIAVLAALFCFAGVTFAQEGFGELFNNDDQADKKTQLITPEEQHTTNKTASVKIEYTPYTDEAHVYYTCVAVTFDQGEAMNTVMAVLEDFKKENQYYNYRYLRKDSVKYFKDDKNMKWATYHSYVQFTR